MGERSRSSGVLRLKMENSLDWPAVSLGVILAGIHIYLGVTNDESPFVVGGIGVLLDVALFLTKYWRPILYVLGVVYALILGFIWILNGMEYRMSGIVTGVVSTIFLVLISYLFVREGQLIQ
jgi:hypothetical protein